MLTRIFAALLGAYHAGNGLFMLTAPTRWFATIPGVADTGPYNPHFVADVGFAFLAAGLAFFAMAIAPRLKLLALGASGFLVFHAVLHLAELAQGHSQQFTELLTVAAPALLGVVIAWPRKGEPHA